MYKSTNFYSKKMISLFSTNFKFIFYQLHSKHIKLNISDSNVLSRQNKKNIKIEMYINSEHI